MKHCFTAAILAAFFVVGTARAEFASSQLGDARLDRSSINVGERTNLTLTYRPGATLRPGAAIMVATHWQYPYVLQHETQGGTHFVTADVAGATFARKVAVLDGLFGGLLGYQTNPVFEVTEGTVPAGRSITVRYNNFEAPTQSASSLPLAILVRESAGDAWQLVPPATLPVLPGRAENIDLIAPAIAEGGKPFDVAVRVQDRFGNLVAVDSPSFDVLIDGRFSTRIPAGSNPVPVFSPTLTAQGPHEIEVRSPGGGLRSNRTVYIESAPRYRVHWVELHAHSEAGDALLTSGELDVAYRGSVDSVVVADADSYLDSSDWGRRTPGLLDGFVRNNSLQHGGWQLVLSESRFDFSDAPRDALPDLRSLNPRTAFIAALPEVPADLRGLDPALLKLVEIKSGDATHEWYGNRVASAGYRVGFIGSASAHHDPMGPPATIGRTAVLVAGNESVVSALRAGRTYVTSGPHIHLEMNVNGAAPGTRASENRTRSITGEVIGTAPILSVELIRNGEMIAARHLAHASTAEPDEEGNTPPMILQVTFEADIGPIGNQHDVPRNGREWIGYVRVPGAIVANIDAPGFRNSVRQAFAVNPRDTSRADFITWTRGHPSSFMLQLDAQGEDELEGMVVELNLRAGIEDVSQIPTTRTPAEIPAARMLVSLDELLAGTATRTYEVDGYQDRVTFELVNPAAPLRRAFDFTDVREHGHGDYYYVRVRQLDDHMVWSSPVWVGGFDAR